MIHLPTDCNAVSRAIEVCLALGGLMILSPLMVVSALLVKASSVGTIFFRQQRIGRGGCEFTIYKFRTMRSAATGPNVTAADDCRITAIGKWLRKTKIDELPQLWNVLRGDMRFVGPRPEVPEFVDLSDPLWQEILASRPGLTDPVTLALRNEELLLARVENKLEFYTQTLQPLKLRGWARFLRHKTWKTDVAIVFQTVKVILLPQTAPELSLPEEFSDNVVCSVPDRRNV